jgi:hypothetical protein
LGGTTGWIDGGDGWDATPALVEEGFKTVKEIGFKDGILDNCWLDMLNTTSSNVVLVYYRQLQERIGQRSVRNHPKQ